MVPCPTSADVRMGIIDRLARVSVPLDRWRVAQLTGRIRRIIHDEHPARTTSATVRLGSSDVVLYMYMYAYCGPQNVELR